MLHAAIRGLNSLADLETLQAFSEKYFGNTVENRDPTLLEILRFEEEILRQKITWREKYESVISGWLSSKLSKKKLKIYKNDGEQHQIEASRSEDAIAESKPDVDVKDEGKTEEVHLEKVPESETPPGESEPAVTANESRNLVTTTEDQVKMVVVQKENNAATSPEEAINESNKYETISETEKTEVKTDKGNDDLKEENLNNIS